MAGGEMSQGNFPEIIQALLDPKVYPHSPPRVELVQTQMSSLFLAGDFVYKVKKPVDLGYLDYTTLEKRHFYCRKEVELNRRLCPDAYLGVVVITGQGGRLSIDGQGRPLEYAVKMRRLPQEAMLNARLARDEVTPEMLAAVAAKLADFHRRAEANAEISAFGDLGIIRQNTMENFEQTDKYIGTTISPERYQRLKAYTEDFLGQNASLFRRRASEGKIRDCHGDLHAAHICFWKGICIYDCIEFNDRFRYGDVASEVAFLAMDLDHYGRADLSRHFVNAYISASGDRELETLLDFYRCYRAYVRGKVEGFKLDDPHIDGTEKEKILVIARDYFELADSYIMQVEGK
jgi:aminoglycoside phosphotransferase family enzyme